MHDVALSVMGKECAVATQGSSQIKCVVANEKQIQNGRLLDTVRHLFLSVKEPEILLNDSLAKSSPAVQTLLCDGSPMTRPLQYSSKYSSLQALRLCSDRISFPLKPKHLHHLRYLDISKSWIRALPEDISILHNLQTLNMSGCPNLDRFPRQLKYMTALHHLYTHECPNIKDMPPDLGKLTSLQTLTCFVAGTSSDCSDVGELQNLKLGGELELNKLGNVTVEDAKAINLESKDQLRELTLKWRPDVEDYARMSRFEDDARVLEVLKPHDKLEAISIDSYASTTFPTWMSMLQNMVEIHLSHCRNLKYLFTGDTPFAFPNLKEITLEYLDSFERLSEIDTGSQGEEIIFPRLEKLAIGECRNFAALPEAFPSFPALKTLDLSDLSIFQGWEAVEETQGQQIMFPQLESLIILNCEKFTALPGQSTFPNLQDVFISDCPEFTSKANSRKLRFSTIKGSEEQMSQWLAGNMTSLTKLDLCTSGDTETTSVGSEHSLSQVVVAGKEEWNHEFSLTCMRLRGLKSSVLELFACFIQLQDLTINACDALVHWPEKEFQCLVSLRRLWIFSCSNLSGYAQAPLVPSTSSQRRQLLPSLEFLEITNCHNLVEVFDVPASLRTMEIYICSKVESIFGRRLLQQGKPASSIVSEVVPSSSAGARGEHFLLPCLESLKIRDCRALSFLPDVPQAYSSLQSLRIEYCPGIKTLPTCLQQRLGSLQEKFLDARYEGPRLWKPNTWKYAIREN